MTAVVAKCTHCLYELDFKHLEYDINKQGMSIASCFVFGWKESESEGQVPVSSV